MTVEFYADGPGDDCPGQPLTAFVNGSGFSAQAGVSLVRGDQPDVPASSVLVFNAQTIVADFDMGGVALGGWRLAINNPDSFTATSADRLPVTLCPDQGACCLYTGTCVDVLFESFCDALGGTFQGDGTTCAGVSCP